MEENVRSNSVDIVSIKETISTHETQLLEIETETLANASYLHQIQQEKFSEDLVLSGFTVMPDLSLLKPKLCGISGLKPSKISHIFLMKSKNPSKPKVVISLRDREAKSEMFSFLKRNGPILQKQLCGVGVADCDAHNVTLVMYNRLTKYNLDIRTKLFELRKSKKVATFRFHNNCFQYKTNLSADWVVARQIDPLLI